MRTIGPDRKELKDAVGQCMNCRVLRTADWLDVHEIASGPAREDCLHEPILQLVLCRECHDHVQSLRPAKQIAIHFRWLINYACEKYCELTGTAPTHVTAEDVITFLMMGKRAK